MRNTRNPLEGHRVNFYLDDKYFRIWNSIPKMRRSKWIRQRLDEEVKRGNEAG